MDYLGCKWPICLSRVRCTRYVYYFQSNERRRTRHAGLSATTTVLLADRLIYISGVFLLYSLLTLYAKGSEREAADACQRSGGRARAAGAGGQARVRGSGVSGGHGKRPASRGQHEQGLAWGATKGGFIFER